MEIDNRVEIVKVLYAASWSLMVKIVQIVYAASGSEGCAPILKKFNMMKMVCAAGWRMSWVTHCEFFKIVKIAYT